MAGVINQEQRTTAMHRRNHKRGQRKIYSRDKSLSADHQGLLTSDERDTD